MAVQVVRLKKERIKKVTSIGDSPRSKPKNKGKRRTWKRYRGQGKNSNR